MSTRKTAIITGATGVIGKAIARQMAEKNFRVFVVARNEDKARQTVQNIKSATGNPEVDYLLIDASRKSSISEAAAKWQGPLDVLINNAAATPRRREETPEGIEMQFATNVLGYFWMTEYFTPFLKMSAAPRIVNVASYWAGDLNIDDLECKNQQYNNNNIYRQSKQANRMLSVAFAEKLKNDGISVNAVHPGEVNSRLSNNLGFGGHESPDLGADTPVWAATAIELEGVSGKYFEYRRETICRFGKDKMLVEKLFEICQRY
ncbi:MAG: SDR family NAD(P)-dependent oxidoreductase [Bacteroidales bacterium]|nr:SDR family NAD(P)-dependent oxidoreductase [Bacteroidales bacterium]